MKHVIKGKVYDTENAKELHAYWNGKSDTDFYHLEESLYRTKRGNYFRAGYGGAYTDYAIDDGRGILIGSYQIKPLTEQEALAWAESHGMPADKIMKLFTVEEA